MSAQPARAYYGIGEVLAQLSGEFPDIRISKIRFLESEGLIQPARSPSGYRRFSRHDVQRLRYILTAQRDHYLPLRVIKEKLDGPDGAADELARFSITLDDAQRIQCRQHTGRQQMTATVERKIVRPPPQDSYFDFSLTCS